MFDPMLAQIRTRDCIVLVKGDTMGVNVTEDLATQGWPGAQGVTWAGSTKDEFLVQRSDGRPAGFLLWGSDEVPDRFTAMTRLQPTYRISVFCFGSWVMLTTTYEKYTYASRIAGPLVPIVYQANDILFMSNRGYLTIEDEWTLSGDPRAPNILWCGHIIQPPSPMTDEFMTVQMSV